MPRRAIAWANTPFPGSIRVSVHKFAGSGGWIGAGDQRRRHGLDARGTALVMVMLPGLALFYGGLVRRKNVLSTIMHSFFGLALVSVLWVLIGFSLAFGHDITGLGCSAGPTTSASATSASRPTRPTARRSRSSCSPASS